MVLVREQQGIDLRCFCLYTDICIDLYYYTGNPGIDTASPGIVSRSKQPTQTQCPETAASRKQGPREGSHTQRRLPSSQVWKVSKNFLGQNVVYVGTREQALGTGHLPLLEGRAWNLRALGPASDYT